MTFRLLTDDEVAVLTDEELAVYYRAVELESRLSSPLAYAGYVSPGTQMYRHHVLLDEWFMALYEGRLYHDGPGPAPVPRTGADGEPLVDEDGFVILGHPDTGERPKYNLLVTMPPRHGKSYFISEHVPGWFLTKHPDYSVLLASYEAGFAAEWGEKVKNHLCDHPELGVEVVGGRSASRARFTLEGHRGFMKTAGAGGPLTGSGGQLLICDDPIKNAEEALSQTERDNTDNWWRTTFYTRREPWVDGTPGRVVLLMTPWHEDDVAGRRVPTKPGPDGQWAKLNLMAIFEPTDDEPEDPLGRSPGEALCPERVPKRELEAIRSPEGSGEQWFQAMYQGHPSLEDGNFIKRPFHYWTMTNGVYEVRKPEGDVAYINEKDCYRFATLDLAASDRKHADWTVMAIFDVTPTAPRLLMLRGLERIRIQTEHHESHIKEWYARWKVRALHIEDKTYGTNLIGRLKYDSSMTIVPVSGDQNPLVRVMPVQYEIRNGRLWFPQSADWLPAFEAELVKFPNAKHDDQVDVLAYGVQAFQHLPDYMVKPREPETMEEKVIAHRKELGRRKRPGRRNIPGIGRW